jgi:hypothetical protein
MKSNESWFWIFFKYMRQGDIKINQRTTHSLIWSTHYLLHSSEPNKYKEWTPLPPQAPKFKVPSAECTKPWCILWVGSAPSFKIKYRSGIPCSRPEVANNYFWSFFPFAVDKFRFSRFTHSLWLRVLKVFAGFAYRILAVSWQGTQDILTVQFRILPPIFFVIRATTRVTRPLLARRSVMLIQFVGAWDWVLGLAAF